MISQGCKSIEIIDDKGVLIADSIEPSMEGKKLDN